MPLERSCEKYVGKLVFCIPIEYYGWTDLEPNESLARRNVPVPNPFHARISELHRYAGELRSLVGVIRETGHPYDQLWVGFCIRDSYLSEETDGKIFFDLAANLGKYNIVIGSSKPRMQIAFDKPMTEWIQIDGSPAIHGFGYLSEGETSLEQIYAEARKPHNS